MQRHVDYIHYNPVKHGLVEQVEQWPWSTFHKYAKDEAYRLKNWRQICPQIETLTAGE